MTIKRTFSAVLAAASLTATIAFAAEVPGGDFARLSSQYASWAGGKSNADALVGGMRGGTPVTLVTPSGVGRSASIVGFTPAAPMTYGAIQAALSGARQTLARLGVNNPTAEQIQAALIGGELELASGNTRMVAGTLVPRG